MPKLYFLTSSRLDTSFHLLYSRYLDSLATIPVCGQLEEISFLKLEGDSFPSVREGDYVYFLRGERLEPKIREYCRRAECREL